MSRRDWAAGRHAGYVGREGDSVMKFDESMVRRTELIMVVAVMMLVLVAYVISKM
jgi:hypothetical protein